MKQRLLSFLMALIAVIAFAGCSSNEKDAATVLEEAQQKMTEVTSLQATMDMNVKMAMGTEEISTITTADITTFREPLKMKLDVASYTESAPEQKTILQMYIQESENEITVFSNAGTGWVQTTAEDNSLGQFLVYENILRYLSAIDSPVNKGTEKIGDISTDRIVGTLKGETMEQIIEESGVLSSAESVGISEEQLKEMYSEIDGLPITLWIGEDGLVYQYETDITKLIQVVMDKTIELIGADNFDEDMNVSVQNASISASCSNFNEAAEFEIPTEALEAAQ
ncbi:MAG: hypothetical protein PHU31_08155 [Anaerotignum sp.]|nr:hypothetical protein [Anaerotignum sp.]